MEDRGFRVTSLVQAVLDCIVRVELPAALAVAGDVLGSRRKEGEGLTRNELEEASGRLASAAKRRRVLAILALAVEAAESVGESRSRALIHVLGLPAPVLQHAFYGSDGFIGRTDFFWPEYGVIGEFDGDAEYLDDDLLGGRTAREAVLAEKNREYRFRALGYMVVRWDWKAVTKPGLLGQKLAAAGLPRRNPRRVD